MISHFDPSVISPNIDASASNNQRYTAVTITMNVVFVVLSNLSNPCVYDDSNSIAHLVTDK